MGQPALLGEGGVLEGAHVDADAAGNVIADVLQPAHLLGDEGASGSFLHGQPALEAVAHSILERDELIGLADGVAH